MSKKKIKAWALRQGNWLYWGEIKKTKRHIIEYKKIRGLDKSYNPVRVEIREI